MFLLEIVKIGVSQEQEIIWSCVLLIDDSRVELLWCITEIAHELLNSVFFLKRDEYFLTLISKVSKNLFQKIGGLMLAQVSEVSNILLKVVGGELICADIYHLNHKLLKDDHVRLGSSVLETDMEDRKSI